VLRSDLAPAVAAVLTEDGHEGKVYDLTGQDAVSWTQLAKLASKRAGKPIPYRSISEAEAKARLQAAGLPEAYIPSMLGFYAAYRAGWSGTPTGHIEQLACRPATPSLDAIAAVLDGTAK
jgi:NAD(P)H dehydrogenase (quinone)